jgi:acetolactate synthase-1/2/3 large subunit
MDRNTSERLVSQLKHLGAEIVFSVSGGFCSHIMEALRKAGIEVVHFNHEQACAMAADSYARIKKKPAVVLVTNGPGSSNTLTGVLGAYQDSIPMVIISGNVPRHQSISNAGRPVRQFGVQEADIIPVVKSITKFAVQLTESDQFDMYLMKAWVEATSGRMGPVWLDIPLDLQNIAIDTDSVIAVEDIEYEYSSVGGAAADMRYREVVDSLNKASRPVIIAGSGVHLANCEEAFLSIVKSLGVPVVCTWHATDLFDYDDELYVGNFGLLGERAGNFAVQNADLLLILGSRMSIPNVGYETQLFSPGSRKIMVDIDDDELAKISLDIDVRICADLAAFLFGFANLIPQIVDNKVHGWVELLTKWKKRFPIVKEDHLRVEGRVNSYDFIDLLSGQLKKNDVVVTDMGASSQCTMQSMRNTGKNRLFTSSGTGSMGFGLPGAIGAFYADKSSRVVCIAGDGGFQMNIQELQTVVHNSIPLKIFILNSEGYLAISIMQKNLFKGNYFGSTPSSGVSSPSFARIAEAYGISSIKIECLSDLTSGRMNEIMNSKESFLCEVMIPDEQLMIPRVQSQIDENGKMMSDSIDNMFPYLSDCDVDQINDELAKF